MADDDEIDFAGGEELPSRRSRTSERRERVSNEDALAELVTRLRALTAGQLEAVGVPELVLDALRDAKQIKSYAALERHLRFTRGLLRGVDWQPLLRRVDLVRAGFSVDETEETGAGFEWTNKLLIQGEPALRQFIEQFPETDRRRIRQLMQNVKRSSEARRAKARRILETAVHNAIEHARAEEERKSGAVRRIATNTAANAAAHAGATTGATMVTGFYDDLDDEVPSEAAANDDE